LLSNPPPGHTPKSVCQRCACAQIAGARFLFGHDEQQRFREQIRRIASSGQGAHPFRPALCRCNRLCELFLAYPCEENIPNEIV
jgi:hypothetical protein